VKIAACLPALFAGLTLSTAPIQDARACTCLGGTVDQYLENADYAFAGTVVDVDTIEANNSLAAFLIAQVAVAEIWKGEVPANFELRTRTRSASCGYNDPWARFEIGQKFVFFAHAPNEDIGHVYTTLCSGNRKYEEASEHLERLGPGSSPVGVEEEEERVSTGFLLGAPYPQPARAAAELTLRIDRAQHVSVGVFNLLGQRVATLHDAPLPAGTHRKLSLSTGTLPTGIYFIRAAGDQASQVRRVVVAH